MITAAVEEAEDIVVVEEEGMAEVGTVADVTIMVAVEVGEDMAAEVTVSFCLYPHQGLLLFVLHP